MSEDLQIKFPLEFVVLGVPASLQGRPRGREAWKEKVTAACVSVLPQNAFLSDVPVAVSIFHFPDGEMEGDIDNIIKPILDALTKVVYHDDKVIERIVCQRFEETSGMSWGKQSPILTSAISGLKPTTYVIITDQIHGEVR
jgi:crossover junction endodeoxyribonuclease RusA